MLNTINYYCKLLITVGHALWTVVDHSPAEQETRFNNKILFIFIFARLRLVLKSDNEFYFVFIYSIGTRCQKMYINYLLELLRSLHDICIPSHNRTKQWLKNLIIFNSRLNMPFQAWN